MKRCGAEPYKGNEKYIFVSYSHKDKKFVFPIIEQMAKDGYRIWYDEGIDPGSEWPEIIAAHLNDCFSCIAFISDNSINSHNCRREINFALLKKKRFISVVLEEVQMSLGMEMQLSVTQSIFKYKHSSDQEFFAKLYEAKFLHECLGKPNPDIIVSKSSDYDENLKDLFGRDDLIREPFSDRWFLEADPAYNTELSDEDAVFCNNGSDRQKNVWLIRCKTNEKIDLPLGEFKLGRSDTINDYAVIGNSAIGRLHALIRRNQEKSVIVDCSSKNRTFLNAKALDPEIEYDLHDGDFIRLANEEFIFKQTES
ncbi:MAG TPA: TIR domain-containing protein [Clostridiaceae bacterium]|nr:TIR domain-containing protein [Clostridiaceae bacterium]